MSSPREKAKSLLYTYGIILLGSAILAFGLYNIHERTQVTEGGVLGMTLFLQHWLGLSPAITSPVMDIACYLLAWRFLGNSFARYAITASLAFAAFHAFCSSLVCVRRSSFSSMVFPSFRPAGPLARMQTFWYTVD